jgi:hypothetical protein
MNKEKAKAAFEIGDYVYQTNIGKSTTNIVTNREWVNYMGGYWNYKIKNIFGWVPEFKLSKGKPEDVRMTKDERIEKLQAELDWHKKELARVDHELVDACDRANKLQADLKSVNFSYWKKCEELSQLQEQNSKLLECVELVDNQLNKKSTFYNAANLMVIVQSLKMSVKQCLEELEGSE